jgi:hypothetical protein
MVERCLEVSEFPEILDGEKAATVGGSLGADGPEAPSFWT